MCRRQEAHQSRKNSTDGFRTFYARTSYNSFPSCGLGMQYRKLLLPVILEARASETWVTKLELGNQNAIVKTKT
jgi:hypothetical protein